MRKYEDPHKGQLMEVHCNRCGKKLCVEKGIIMEGVYPGDYIWGYFSKKDTQHHVFDLCEECYDHIVKDFKIPVEQKAEKELL